MKPNKFSALVEKHPYWEILANWYASPRAQVSQAEIKSFVREQVEYIAYRKFWSLDLEVAKNWHEESRPIEGFYDHQRIWKSTIFTVYFWVGNEKLPRSRRVDNYQQPEETVWDVVLNIANWHDSAEDKVGEIKWGFVLKQNSSGGVHGRTSTSFDVYPFPKEYSI